MKQDTSLAFVDVITNGLGGMLVLFFIVVLVQSQLEWADQAESASSSSRQSEPFVLIVTAEDGAAPFNVQDVDPLWKFDGLPAGQIAHQRGVQWDWGQAYAVFVSDRPLGLNARVSIRTPTVPVRLKVELYPSGAQKRTYEIRAEPGSRWTEVWPAITAS